MKCNVKNTLMHYTLPEVTVEWVVPMILIREPEFESRSNYCLSSVKFSVVFPFRNVKADGKH